VRLFLLSVAAGLLVVAGVAAYGELASLRQSLSTGQQALASASSGISGGALDRAMAGELDLNQSCTDLSTAAGAFGDAATTVNRMAPLVRLVEQVPATSARTESSIALVAVATEVSAAGDELCQGLQPLAKLLKDGQAGERPLGEQVLTTLATARPDLEQARTRLAGAEIAMAKVRPEEQDASTRDALIALNGKLPGLRNTVDALLMLPDLLGATDARTYLLVAENREELRPTGGYIGTAGVVTVNGGKIERQEFGTSVAYDLGSDILVPPPAPLVRYLQSSYWQMRDANWWPDFPSSAEQLAYFYNGTRDDRLDGVIAFDQHALELLLAETGPITVADYGETVSAENLQERLDYYVHANPGLDEEYSRKQFVGSAATAVIQTLTSAPPDRLRAYADAVGQALAGKHLMLYLGESSAAHLAAELNWDGHLYQGAGDYVYAVHANVSPNKIDPYVQRSMAYAVDLTANPPRARLTIDVKNTFDPAQSAPWLTTHYRDYLRVYVPFESALQGATGFADDAQTITECGRTSFAGLVDVPPGEQATVVLEYTLNPAVLDGGYSLAVQKQAGLDPTPLSVEVTDRGGKTTANAALARDVQYRLRGNELAGRDLPVAASARLACTTSKPEPKVLAPPVTMSIPKIGVSNGPITALKVLPTGEMEVPGDGEHIGWYEASARPGAPGNFVSAAHVDWAGKLGVFWGLNDLQPGDQISVTDTDGVAYTYAVEWNKAVRPEDAPLMDLVGPSHDAIMTLITCTGNFNRVTRSYDHRQVVRARLVTGA
jgi:LPXTG-site transpeptidase (sortase) family protein